MSSVRLISLLVLTMLAQMMAGCAWHYAYRTNVLDAATTLQRCPANVDGVVDKACDHVTPEIFDKKYELNFVEFDDQGWSFADHTDTRDEHPSQQIDQLMRRLRTLLDNKENLKIILFVHGWKHSALSDDNNVRDFRRLLERAAADELYHKGAYDPKRKVIGIYVGWRGNPWILDESDPALDVTFWSRKNAASRIAFGSVRELFARLRSIRRYYNSMALERHETVQPVRSLMIGHSFGGLILYTATSGPLIETLTAKIDLNGLPNLHSAGGTIDGRSPAFETIDRVADMIVLVNPAFEASRFQPLYTIAERPTPEPKTGEPVYEPPVLVSITSATDQATKLAFPVGRFVNTLFERPTSSDDQAKAIKRTPGNMEVFLTHKLSKPGKDEPYVEPCHDWQSVAQLKNYEGNELENAVTRNKEAETTQSNKEIALISRARREHQPWTRTFCGGATLSVLGGDGSGNINTQVWNVIAEETVINGHGDVMNPNLLDVVRQIFSDTDEGLMAKTRTASTKGKVEEALLQTKGR